MLMRHMIDGLKLDRLIMIPAGRAPHKSTAEYAPAKDRVEMCRLAVSDIPKAEVSTWEIEQDGPSYTIDTVRYFAGLYPKDTLFLAMGGDMLRTFTQWESWREILDMATLAAVSREKDEFEILEQSAQSLRQYGKIILLKTPDYIISSTEIRDMAENGKNFSCYLPKKVVEYIVSNKIYRAEEKTS